jgi:hypothetical protein
MGVGVGTMFGNDGTILLTKMTLNVSEWPSFDLNQHENGWQDLKMAV